MEGITDGQLYLLIEKSINSHIVDNRQWCHISKRDVLNLFIQGMSYGCASLHALDNLGRIPHIIKFTGSSRKQVASDSTLARLFASQYSIPDDLSTLVLDDIKSYLPIPASKKLLLIDGSGQSGRLYSIAALNWDSPIVIGIEQQEKHGKELPTSKKQVLNLINRTGSSFDIVVGDALYFDQEFFQILVDHGKDLFVKTREANLDIVQYTESQYKISLASRWKKIPEKTHFDEKRGLFYKVFHLKDYHYKYLEKPLQCFRIEERDPKTDTSELFFCITTAEGLSSFEAREIAKLRWQIEDNVFRHGNQLFHTKHRFFRNDKTNRKYLTLLYLLLGLFQFLFVQALKSGSFTSHSMNLKVFIEWAFAEWHTNSS